MIVRRGPFNDDPNQQTRVIGTTTTPGSRLVALACRDSGFAPVSRCPPDFVAGTTQSVAPILRVNFRRWQTSLLPMT
jgi:hypothetical protein